VLSPIEAATFAGASFHLRSIPRFSDIPHQHIPHYQTPLARLTPRGEEPDRQDHGNNDGLEDGYAKGYPHLPPFRMAADRR
jgi:hypothetical protein